MFKLSLLKPSSKFFLEDLANARRVVTLSLQLIVLIVIQIGILLFVHFQLQKNLSETEQTLQSASVISPAGKILSIAEATRSINTLLTPLKPLASNPPLDPLLVTLAKAIPSGVQLKELSLSLKTNELRITGVAVSRNDIPLLQRNIAGIPQLIKPNVQFDLNERSNIEFTIASQVSPEGIR